MITPGTYEPGDYILIDQDGNDQAVSGNTDFWEVEDGFEDQVPSVHEFNGTYTIVKVVVVQKLSLGTIITRQESEED
jgi:hypothetical protein